ncbi:MAG TPA: hypothetical protein VGF02_06540 [Pseudolabrys sp.]|jgi:hypothetical protein
MQYFDPADDNPARIGRVLGDAFAAFIVIALILIFTQSMLSR